MELPYKYIVIEGNIGAGKTSFSRMAATRLGGRLVLEQFADNPFLPLFYNDPSRYAFALEMSFLAARFKQLNEQLTQTDLFSPITFSDYYFTKSLVFARNTLSGDEYNLYRQMFEIVYRQLPEPQLYIYLHSNTQRLLANIAQRGRGYEAQISEDYLLSVQKSYFDYFKTITNFPVVVVECSAADFVNNPEHFEQLFALLHKTDVMPGLQILSPFK